uniref:RRM domain-containing protein n=1 Tax=Trichuris muris TaxID=70415 RepID=A0A5S6Q8X4_TRIMR
MVRIEHFIRNPKVKIRVDHLVDTVPFVVGVLVEIFWGTGGSCTMPRSRRHGEYRSHRGERRSGRATRKRARHTRSDYSTSRCSSASSNSSFDRYRRSHVRRHRSRRRSRSVRRRSDERRRLWRSQKCPLTETVREKHLMEIFGRFGHIDDVRVVSSSADHYKMAIVRFRHGRDALDAHRVMDCGMIDNLVVNVEPLKTRTRKTQRARHRYRYR